MLKIVFHMSASVLRALFGFLAAIPIPAKAAECSTATITAPMPFMGNSGEIFQLSDGSFWQVGPEYSYMYAYSPSVIICPSIGKLSVDGHQLTVTRIK